MLLFQNLEQLQSHYNYMQVLLGQKRFFVVGGVVRDLLLGRDKMLDDIDVTLAGAPVELSKSIRALQTEHNFSYFETLKYGTMTVIPKDLEIKTHYEITPFRTESDYADVRHPDEINWSDSLFDDSKRRDFAINCIYYARLSSSSCIVDESVVIDQKKMLKQLDRTGLFFEENSKTLILQNKEIIENLVVTGYDFTSLAEEIESAEIIHLVIDPHQGVQDLIHQKIQCVGEPDRRFKEDALRLIRALRFSIALECDLHKKTRVSLQKNAYLIRQIAKERIKQELDKVFKGNNPFGFVALLDETNMLKRIFPKLYDNKGINQPLRYHPFDVYTHSMMVLFHTQKLSDDYLLRYAALYHDVGKVEQYTSYTMGLDQDGIRDVFASWLNHPVCGAEFTQKDFRALGFSKKEIEQISWLVRWHMKPGEILYGDEKNIRKKTRKLISQVGPEWVKKICILTISDRLGQYNPIQAPALGEVKNMMSLVDTLMEEEGRFTLSKLAINGNVLIKECNLSASPELGKLLQEIFQRVEDDIANRNDRTVILDWVRRKKL